jgi:hypothetical protein
LAQLDLPELPELLEQKDHLELEQRAPLDLLEQLDHSQLLKQSTLDGITQWPQELTKLTLVLEQFTK